MSLVMFKCPNCGNNTITLGMKSKSGVFSKIKCSFCGALLELNPWVNYVYLILESLFLFGMIIWAFFNYSWMSWSIFVLVFILVEIVRVIIVPLIISSD